MIVVLISSVIVGRVHSAELLRTPKVYNALITTDQNLTPSRAYPVLQPTIHDSPFVYSPYNFSPYGFYDSFGFNEFGGAGGNAPPFFSRYNPNVQSSRVEIANNQAVAAAAAQSSAASAAAITTNSVGNDRSFVVNRNSDNRNALVGGNEKSPIPLNEFGLPPNLIPIAPYGNVNQNPIDLAPYNYNSYPLIFDQFGGFQQGPYLPHFGNVPQNAYAAFGAANRPPPNGNAAFGGAAGNGFGGAGEGIGNGQPVNGIIDNRAVIGLPGSPGGVGVAGLAGGPGGPGVPVNAGVPAGLVDAANEQVSFNRENFNGFNGAAQHADFVQSSSHGAVGDAPASAGSQSSFQQSSSSTSSVSSTSSGGHDDGGVAQTSGGGRNGRVFYFTDDIKNNKNRNENIVDVPPPPLPYGARAVNGQ